MEERREKLFGIFAWKTLESSTEVAEKQKSREVAESRS
jgi:hypothetical protein